MASRSLDDFLCLLGANPTIVVERDPACRMARITVDGNHAMEGNDWDFYPGCHGGWHRELSTAHGPYSTPAGMASVLSAAIAFKGGDPRIIEAEYRWPRDGRSG